MPGNDYERINRMNQIQNAGVVFKPALANTGEKKHSTSS